MINLKYYLLFILVLDLLPNKPCAQELIRYNEENPIAKVNFNNFLYGIFSNRFDNFANYPAIGAYSPTLYAQHGVKIGAGDCNYIYIPTENLLEPGQQYHISLTIKLAEAYRYQPYYQEHFGIALTSELYDNYHLAGLWTKHFIPFGLLATEEFVTLNFEFRPLCTSKYLNIGVFQGATMDEKNCFACPYNFELHELIVKKSINKAAEFHYACDEFVEDKIDKWNTSYGTDTIYFDSGSAIVKEEYRTLLDSLPNKLRTVQDLISLYAFTDKKGSENEQLGAERNTAVRKILIDGGADSSRILLTNYGETKSLHINAQKDRKVEIDVNLGKLYQKNYSEALQAADKGDYGSVQNKMIKNWLRMVPPKYAIYALFDCWGNGTEASRFRQVLINNIRSKFYKGNKLKFTLDSLFCENLDSRELKMYIGMNRLPISKYSCEEINNLDLQKESRNLMFLEEIYTKHGFPSMEKVGKLGNKTLPNIILKSNDINFLQKYLPLVKIACEKQNIPWKYYAILFDKINSKRFGFQRYGTKMNIHKGTYTPIYPIENIEMLSEYRAQVKLAPFPDFIITEFEEFQNNIDKPLIKILNDVFKLDQIYRNQSNNVEQQYGRDSDELKAHWKLMYESDSMNVIRIKEILDNRGWLSSKIIGNHGNATLFLVIQHADLETQLRYLPMMREAVTKGNAKAYDLAMLEDRIAIKQGKRQIYGTQIGRDPETDENYISPLIDPINVNKRRKKVGLRKIEDYIKHWNLKWDIEKHKKRTKLIESKKY